MSFKVKVHPSGHEFEVETHESILDSGLRAGLNLDYHCANGTCGGCGVRLLRGRIRPTCFSDFHFSEAEQADGWFLACCNTPDSDLEIEAHETGRAEEIPEQHLTAKVSKVERLQDEVLLLQVRTPRSQSLRFLAGQAVALCFDGMRPKILPIASCPCDGTHLRFHLRRRPDDRFSEFAFERLRKGRELALCGPSGNFTLDEESTRPLIFVAWESGFAPIESIIDHAIQIDAERPMHLYWLSAIKRGHYLSNYCRAWVDALDDFHYHSVDLTPFGREGLDSVCARIIERHTPLSEWDLYLAMPEANRDRCRQWVCDAGVPEAQLRTTLVAHP